jgi:hypothetical protein
MLTDILATVSLPLEFALSLLALHLRVVMLTHTHTHTHTHMHIHIYAICACMWVYRNELTKIYTRYERTDFIHSTNEPISIRAVTFCCTN